MKISIGSDHAGVELKQQIMQVFRPKHEFINVGTNTSDSVDYPDFAHLAAKEINNDNVEFGIFICGSGNGIQMTANKHQKIRSALCWNKEIAKLARTHNNANILSIPSRFVTLEEAKEIVNVFLSC